MKNLISIILTLYNKAPYIEETIFSIYKQSYKNWELIIVDDCSTDGSFEIAKAFCEKLGISNKCKFIQNEKNLWVAKTFERGLKESKGDWIAMCDGDDILMKNKLQKNLEYCIKNNIDFCYSDLTAINERNNILYFSYFKKFKTNLKHDKFENFIIRGNAIGSSIFFGKRLKDILKETGFPPFIYQDRGAILIASAIENIKIGVIKEPLIFYRRCEECITRDNYIRNNYEILQERKKIMETEIMIFNYITNHDIVVNDSIKQLKDKRIEINKLLISFIEGKNSLLFALIKKTIFFFKREFFYRLTVITFRKIIIRFSK